MVYQVGEYNISQETQTQFATIHLPTTDRLTTQQRQKILATGYHKPGEFHWDQHPGVE